MIIVVTNFVGGVGKSTITKHLLLSQLPYAQPFEFEHQETNSSCGDENSLINLDDFERLAGELNLLDSDQHCIIDVGASQVREVFINFERFETTRNAVDFWVIPVTVLGKHQVDSMETAVALIKMGVDASKIIMIFNNVQNIKTIERDFENTITLSSLGVNICNKVILASTVYDKLKSKNDKNVFDVSSKSEDWAALKKEAKESVDKDALKKLGMQMVLVDGAKSAVKNLKSVFEATPIFTKLSELS